VTTGPRVICHVMASVDGRIVTEDRPLSPEGRRLALVGVERRARDMLRPRYRVVDS
jgi:hypothetical protein